jgi:hypothetical protein
MSFDLSSLGGPLPKVPSSTDPKAGATTTALETDGGQSWFSGLFQGFGHSQGPAVAGDAKQSTPLRSSIDWLFANVMGAASPGAAGSQGGPADRAALRADTASQIKANNPDLTQNQVDRRMHGEMIGSQYIDTKQIPVTDPKSKVGTLDSPEEREKFLAGFTQYDPKDPKSESYCAPTALMAAAIQAEGAKGLAPMVLSMQQDLASDMQYAPGDKASMKRAADLQAIQEKIAKGELNNNDIKVIQESLYGQLKKEQERDGTYDDPKDPGISDATMYNHIKNNSYMKDMFNKGNTRLSMVDNDGDDKRNHWILHMGVNNGKPSMVFDPWARRGGQIVREADQVEDYEKTNANTYDENGRPRTDYTPEMRDKDEAERNKKK